MATIPQTQQAAQVLSPGDSFSISIRDDIPVPEPGPNEVLIKLSCTGLWYFPSPPLPSQRHHLQNLEELTKGWLGTATPKSAQSKTGQPTTP